MNDLYVEVSRVLAPSGIFLSISHAAAPLRLPHMGRDGLDRLWVTRHLRAIPGMGHAPRFVVVLFITVDFL